MLRLHHVNLNTPGASTQMLKVGLWANTTCLWSGFKLSWSVLPLEGMMTILQKKNSDGFSTEAFPHYLDPLVGGLWICAGREEVGGETYLPVEESMFCMCCALSNLG